MGSTMYYAVSPPDIPRTESKAVDKKLDGESKGNKPNVDDVEDERKDFEAPEIVEEVESPHKTDCLYLQILWINASVRLEKQPRAVIVFPSEVIYSSLSFQPSPVFSAQ